ncbi:MAG: VOC family protein [Mycobacterium sp.]
MPPRRPPYAATTRSRTSPAARTWCARGSVTSAPPVTANVDATIAFWCNGFGAEVVYDAVFAGARNVFLRVGTGRIHLYDQPPKHVGRGTVHHVGVQTDELEAVVERMRGMEVSVTDIRREPTACYVMAEGPDRLLIEIFQPDPSAIPQHLWEYFGLPG